MTKDSLDVFGALHNNTRFFLTIRHLIADRETWGFTSVPKFSLVTRVNMNLIDLHVHSDASDGSYAPAEVVRLAKAGGLTAR